MGSYLSTPKTDKTSKNGVNDKIKYGSSSMQGWRQTMEDAHVALLDLDKSTSFFGVYDGHAGQEVSKFCAKFLHKELLKHEAYSAGDIATAAKKSFLRMDEMMCSQNGWKELVVLGMDDDDCSFEEGPPPGYDGPTSGSTACVAIIHNNQLIVANAGDSRCVISRKGQACDLSKDHKPDLEVEKERIYEAGGYIEDGRVNGRLNLARAIGDMDMKKDKTLPPEQQPVTANPDINTVELCEDDDFLVIACDGIWDCMSSQQLVDFVHDQLKSESKLSRVCEKVLDKCLAPTSDMEGCDNMTIILVQFKKSESDLLISQPLDSSNGQEVTDSD